ncbi:unnamed protein product, partial [Phaeothamnion confervicola]
AAAAAVEEEARTPLDLSPYETPTALLEVHGAARLKRELERRGVKAGGSPYERAARLFELKGLAPEQYPPALLAKKPKEKSK